MVVGNSEKLAIRTGLSLLKASTSRDFINEGSSKEDWMEHAKSMEIVIKTTCKLIAPIAAVESGGDEE